MPDRHKTRGSVQTSWLTYEESKEMIQRRDIRSREDFIRWHEENKIKWIPKYPHRVYRDEWVSWPDFLGTQNTFGINNQGGSNKPNNWRPYYQAIQYAHSLDLQSMAEWKQLAREDKIPEDIPHCPENVYSEWQGYKQWLGLDKKSSVEVSKQLHKRQIWIIVRDPSEPLNVFWVKKIVKDEINKVYEKGWQVLQAFVYESDLEEQMWDIVKQHSHQHDDDKEDHRFSPNINQVIWQLTTILLIEKV